MLGGALWNFLAVFTQSSESLDSICGVGKFFSVKSHVVDILGFVSHLVCDSTTQLCHEKQP